MAKLTISDFTSLGNETTFITALNAAFAAIEAAFENTLSRDGTTPNQMDFAVDMNSWPIMNSGNIDLAVEGQILPVTTAERDALPIGAGVRLLVYNTETDKINFWDGSQWRIILMTAAS